MKGIICWVVIVAAAGSASVVERSSAPSRIVGGETTTIENYPSIVQVDFRGVFSGTWSQSCGATIITAFWFLSAAHCFVGPMYSMDNRRIRTGATFRNTGGQLYGLRQLINHYAYNSIPRNYDASLGQTLQQIIFTPAVGQASIAGPNYNVLHGMLVNTAGWGTTSQGGTASSQLRQVWINKIDHNICRTRYAQLPGNLIVTPQMICAGLLDVGGGDACQGDSGGPLYHNGVLVGIVSWGYGCAHPTYPGVNAKIGVMNDWVLDVINGRLP